MEKPKLDPLEVAAQVLTERLQLTEKQGPDTKRRATRLHSSCQQLTRMSEVKDKSEEMKRFAANVVIAGTDVLEVFNPALQGVPGILHWSTLSVVGRLRRVNGANDCVERTIEALRAKKPLILKPLTDEKLLDVANEIMATEGAKKVIQDMGITPSAIRTLDGTNTFEFINGYLTGFTGLSDFQGRFAYIARAIGAFDNRLDRDIDPAKHLQTPSAYQQLPELQQAEVRTLCELCVRNASRDDTTDPRELFLAGNNSTALQLDPEDPETLTDAGFAFLDRYFGVDLFGCQICPFYLYPPPVITDF